MAIILSIVVRTCNRRSKILRYNKLQGKSFSLEASLFFEFLFSLRLLPESAGGSGAGVGVGVGSGSGFGGGGVGGKEGLSSSTIHSLTHSLTLLDGRKRSV